MLFLEAWATQVGSLLPNNSHPARIGLKEPIGVHRTAYPG